MDELIKNEQQNLDEATEMLREIVVRLTDIIRGQDETIKKLRGALHSFGIDEHVLNAARALDKRSKSV